MTIINNPPATASLRTSNIARTTTGGGSPGGATDDLPISHAYQLDAPVQARTVLNGDGTLGVLPEHRSTYNLFMAPGSQRDLDAWIATRPGLLIENLAVSLPVTDPADAIDSDYPIIGYVDGFAHDNGLPKALYFQARGYNVCVTAEREMPRFALDRFYPEDLKVQLYQRGQRQSPLKLTLTPKTHELTPTPTSSAAFNRADLKRLRHALRGNVEGEGGVTRLLPKEIAGGTMQRARYEVDSDGNTANNPNDPAVGPCRVEAWYDAANGNVIRRIEVHDIMSHALPLRNGARSWRARYRPAPC